MVFLQNSIDALLHRGMDRFTLRALAILLLCYDTELAWTLTRLSVKLGIPRQAGSHTLERLIGEGFIRRVPHLVDRRVMLLRLTTSGRLSGAIRYPGLVALWDRPTQWETPMSPASKDVAMPLPSDICPYRATRHHHSKHHRRADEYWLQEE